MGWSRLTCAFGRGVSGSLAWLPNPSCDHRETSFEREDLADHGGGDRVGARLGENARLVVGVGWA